MTGAVPVAEMSLSVGSLEALLTSTGALRRLDVSGLSLLQYPASELEPGLGGLWLRRHSGGAIEPLPLTGPASGASVALDAVGATVRGTAPGLAWTLRFAPALADTAWFWHVTVRNTGAEHVRLDAVWASDLALTPYPSVRINEYYVSQYLDLTPVDTATGVALAVRQNMPGATQPWALLGADRPVAGWATDALQLLAREPLPHLDLTRPLPGERLQHEHTLATLATEAFDLAPGGAETVTFYGLLRADHPAATGPADAALAAVALALPEAAPPVPVPAGPTAPADTGTLFASAPPLEVVDLAPDEIPGAGAEARLLEETAGGWGAFVADSGEAFTSRHKEHAVLRPHGHVQRTGTALTPTTTALTSTVYLAGLFASQVTQGHVARSTLITGRRTYLGLQRAHGLRAFADFGAGWRLLDVPSAWGLLPGRARWMYATGDALLEVTADARPDDTLHLSFRTLAGTPPRLLVAAELAGQGDDHAAGRPDLSVAGPTATVHAPTGTARLAWTGAATAGDDAPLFADGVSRGLPWFTLDAAPGDLDLTLTTDLVPATEAVRPVAIAQPTGRLALSATGAAASEIEALDAALPWFEQNALIHYLSPRGLEQYTGGGWGTRDVSQGPVGLLTALDATAALRVVVAEIMAGQNERGDWPQAFDFLPPKGYWEQLTSHGDVVGWPLLATGDYLLNSGDATLLAEQVPFVAADGTAAPAAPVLEHLERAVTWIEEHTVPGSRLPAYGHGDWNDSLQPADPRLAERMASSWTAVLFVQALTTLAAGLAAAGDTAAVALADRCRAHAASVTADLRARLLADDVLAGYGVFDDDSGVPTALLVHPHDTRTGLTYGVLPWIHAITGNVFTQDEAAHHLDLLRSHLLGPDGARLFDRPAEYRGGPMEIFRRAEAASFFGREVGLMYTHAHLRYAEALARCGDGPGLLAALLLAVPFGLPARVPGARPRQSTCYYSSSDGAFAERYAATARYADLMAGRIDLEGGWRVYSSGPGLFLRLVRECLLGLRRRGGELEIDPVLAPELDGLTAAVPLVGGNVSFRFRVSGAPGVRVRVAGRPIAGTPLTNPYRAAGVRVSLADLSTDAVDVEVGPSASRT